MASDILFNTFACLHGCTVGIDKFSIKGNGSTVNVLSKYYFWMSSSINLFEIGLPSMSVALKNILGTW